MQGLLEPLHDHHVLGEFESLALSLNGELTEAISKKPVNGKNTCSFFNPPKDKIDHVQSAST